MKAGWIVRLALAVGVSVVALGAPALAQDVSVQVEPLSVDVVIGEEGVLAVTITNDGDEATGPLVAQLVVMDPQGGGSADAEDWTSDLNRLIGSLPPGQNHTIGWDAKPIMRGEYLVVITVASVGPGGDLAVVSPVVHYTVGQPNVLVSGATVPVSVAVPLALLVAALVLRRREQRRVLSL